jgi:hypothetical protein
MQANYSSSLAMVLETWKGRPVGPWEMLRSQRLQGALILLRFPSNHPLHLAQLYFPTIIDVTHNAQVHQVSAQRLGLVRLRPDSRLRSGAPLHQWHL